MFLCRQFIDIAGDEQATVLVAGVGRSGTTWVAAVIARMTGARSIFEPFILDERHALALARERHMNNGWLEKGRVLYIEPSRGVASRYYEDVRTILAGRITNDWADKESRWGIYRRRVTKEIRANLLLPYIIRTWPRLKIVWLVRNPIMAINSQLAMARHGWVFNGEYEVICDGDYPHRWLADSISALHRAGSLPEKRAHMWCIETLLPLREAVDRHPAVVLANYDDLASDEQAWLPISRLVAGTNWTSRKFTKLLEIPSLTSRTRVEGKSKPQSAIDFLSAADIGRIEGIVSGYGLERFLTQRERV